MRLFKKKPKLYTKCNELPIHNFNEISANDDLNYLKKNKEDVVNEAELQEAWLGILDEFIRISKNKIAVNGIKKKIELIFLEKRLQVLMALKINIDLRNDVDDICKQYRIKKDKINSHISIVKNDIARYNNNVNEKYSKSDTDFDRSIAVIIKSGYQINRFTTVVSEWCAILNMIQEQNKNT